MGDGDHLEGGQQEQAGPGSTGSTGGQSHGEDLALHLEHDAEGDAEDPRQPESGPTEDGREDQVPFDKESRLSDVDPQDESAG
jgi:hypothetical protein